MISLGFVYKNNRQENEINSLIEYLEVKVYKYRNEIEFDCIWLSQNNITKDKTNYMIILKDGDDIIQFSISNRIQTVIQIAGR